MIKLVIFDFDGTIVDTAPDIVNATNDFRNHYGLPHLAEEIIRHGIGNGLKELLHKVFESEAGKWPEKTKEDFEDHFINIYDQHHLREAKIFPGLLEFLKDWPHQVAILSNKSERFIHSILKHLSLEKTPWVTVLGGDSLSEKKPHPLPFENVLKAAGVLHHEAVMVGDGDPDILGAKAANITSVAVSYGYSPLHVLQSLGAQHSIAHLSELIPLIHRLNKSV